MNEEAQRFWKEQNVKLFSASLEATKRELEAFQNYEPMEIPVYGKIPLMVSAQCIQANQKVCVCQEPKRMAQADHFLKIRKNVVLSV